MSQPVIAVLGAGPGLGAAVARRFAREGFTAALLTRRPESSAPAQRAIDADGGQARAFPCDAADAASVAAAFAEVRAQLGDPEVFVYNAGAFQLGSVLDVTPEQFEACWRANCAGAFLGAQQVLPAMLRRGRGTILLTGATASLRGGARFSCLAVGKFGLRALGQSLARELGPQGIHVAHVIIDGGIDTEQARRMGRDPASLLSPESIAETYLQLHRQDRSAWTQELDLRPSVEKF